MNKKPAYTSTYTQATIPCLVCGGPLTVHQAFGRKSKKPFIMLRCGQDARHFRAFITDQVYVRQVLEHAEGLL